LSYRGQRKGSYSSPAKKAWASRRLNLGNSKSLQKAKKEDPELYYAEKKQHFKDLNTSKTVKVMDIIAEAIEKSKFGKELKNDLKEEVEANTGYLKQSVELKKKGFPVQAAKLKEIAGEEAVHHKELEEIKSVIAKKAVKTMFHHKNQASVASFKQSALKEWEFPSKSTPGKVYTVRLNPDGHLSCNCPAWVFNHGKAKTLEKRECSHTKMKKARGF
jgi:hypothetical protein